MSCRTAVVSLVVLMVGVGVVVAQEKKRVVPSGPPYRIEAKDAPLEWVLEHFLSTASSVYGDGDHGAELYRRFCSEYGIDSSWRSADHLGIAFREIQTEFGRRVNQASASVAFRDRSGQDPNEWRSEALGEAFAAIWEELRADGLEHSFEVFVRIVEKRHRKGFVQFSDEPFDEATISRDKALFWRGAGNVSSEAARFRSEGVQR